MEFDYHEYSYEFEFLTVQVAELCSKVIMTYSNSYFSFNIFKNKLSKAIR